MRIGYHDIRQINAQPRSDIALKTLKSLITLHKRLLSILSCRSVLRIFQLHVFTNSVQYFMNVTYLYWQ